MFTSKKAFPKLFNIPLLVLSGSIGAYLSYNESLFDIYSLYTRPEDSELLSVRLGHQLRSLPQYEKLSYSRLSADWKKLFAWEDLDRNLLDSYSDGPTTRQNKRLVSGTLSKPGGILIKPVEFFNVQTKESICMLHVGSRLCGYPFIIHGGIIATLLNEQIKNHASKASPGFVHLKDDFKVEEINICYKAPVIADQFLLLKTNSVKEEEPARKGELIFSSIESVGGKTLVEAKAKIVNTGRASKSEASSNAKKWILL